MKQSLKECLLNLFLPVNTICALCGRTLEGLEHSICCHCEDELRQQVLTPLECIAAHEPLVRCISAFSYEGAAKELIHVRQYRSDATVAPVLGMYMCAALLRSPHNHWDAVIPVPLHPERLRRRGYNQAALLARLIADCFQLPMREALLTRVKWTRSQTTRNREQRRAAMHGVFQADSKAAGLHILLVDDVLTTGATASACAQALLEAGAASVTLITACQA